MNPLQLISMIKQNNNPINFMQNILGSNPQFQRVMQMVDGKTPEEMKQVAMNLCEQQGIDFSQAVNQMKSMGLNIPEDSKSRCQLY